MIDYTGKTALVTGAGRRLGKHIALSLAAHGMNIIVHYRSSGNEARETARLAQQKGVRAWAIRADFADPEEPANFAEQCAAAAGEVAVLVNSASIFRHGGILDAPGRQFVENLQINALAPLELCRWFAKQCANGSIINILDARMDDYVNDHIPYALSKQALNSLTRMLSLELAPRIRVNGVAPGLILPSEVQGEAYFEKHAGANPLQTRGSEEDISEAVLYLLGANFVTGQVIFVDGGRHLRGYSYDG
ncbi:MAG: SDR family oxidoreductase [Spirochaetales bacterium]|nr:SDR family oxidoreductase [Spirochaetales bacterium]